MEEELVLLKLKENRELKVKLHEVVGLLKPTAFLIQSLMNEIPDKSSKAYEEAESWLHGYYDSKYNK